MQRHLTSVFSDYESMENNSVNSRQLEYWLKQISSPVPSPNTGFQWTFMSNQSSHVDRNTSQPSNIAVEQPHDNISFGKAHYSSVERDKENNSLLLNANNRNSTQTKSKSYVNAMIALQKKVKTLEDQNSFMRKNISKINQERAQSMTQSSVAEEELKSRLKVIEPKVAKIDELIESNKILREAKEERTRKIKALEKSNGQLKAQNQELLKAIENIRKQSSGHKLEAENARRKVGEVEAELRRLLQKNKILEDMKQKSTVTLLEKYNKSIELVESLEKENLKFKNQIGYLKSRHADEIKSIQQGQNEEVKKYLVEFEKLKQNINLKNSIIQQKKKEADYFREAYEKKGQQFMELLRSHHKVIENERSQIKTFEIEIEKPKTHKPEAKPKEKSNEKQLKQKQTQRLQQNRTQNMDVIVNAESQQSSIVRMPQTLIPAQSPPVKRSFEGFDSEEEDEFDESAIPIPVETKSVGKPVKRKKDERKGVLSSESRRNDSKKKNQQSSIRNNNEMGSGREHKKILKKKKNSEKEDGSFTMKSCEAPKTQPMHRITFEPEFHNNEQEERERIANSYYYTTQYPPLPNLSHRNGAYEIQDFHKHNSSSQSIDMAMLVELQKQLIKLYDEQQNLILASNDEYASQADRSQFVGRLKQLNEQLRVKNQKICELKSKV